MLLIEVRDLILIKLKVTFDSSDNGDGWVRMDELDDISCFFTDLFIITTHLANDISKVIV